MAVPGSSIRERIHESYLQVPLQVEVWVILDDDDVMPAADGVDLPSPLQGDADACKTGAQQLNGSRCDWTHQMWVGVQSMKVRQHAPRLNGTTGCTAGVQASCNADTAHLDAAALGVLLQCMDAQTTVAAAICVNFMQQRDLTAVLMVSAVSDTRMVLTLSCQTTTFTCAALVIRRSSNKQQPDRSCQVSM